MREETTISRAAYIYVRIRMYLCIYVHMYMYVLHMYIVSICNVHTNMYVRTYVRIRTHANAKASQPASWRARILGSEVGVRSKRSVGHRLTCARVYRVI